MAAEPDSAPVADAAPEPELPTVRQTEFYDRTEIQTIELTIAPADRQAKFSALPERVYVPATFRWKDIEPR